jgi:hypothetical protein
MSEIDLHLSRYFSLDICISCSKEEPVQLHEVPNRSHFYLNNAFVVLLAQRDVPGDPREIHRLHITVKGNLNDRHIIKAAVPGPVPHWNYEAEQVDSEKGVDLIGWHRLPLLPVLIYGFCRWIGARRMRSHSLERGT